MDTFVPIDTFVMGGAGLGSSVDRYIQTDGGSDTLEKSPAKRSRKSIVVCTRADACGKSVYLKQVCSGWVASPWSLAGRADSTVWQDGVDRVPGSSAVHSAVLDLLFSALNGTPAEISGK